MADNVELTPTLYAVHVPDPGAPPDHVRPDTVELGAGMIEVGVDLGGRRLALQRYKADDIMQALEQHAQSGEQPQPSS